jgi:hypothetical protein
MFDYQATRAFLTEACAHYGKSAPALETWLDELYVALSEAPATVTVWELMQLQALRLNGEWEQPNYAQNRFYKSSRAIG